MGSKVWIVVVVLVVVGVALRLAWSNGDVAPLQWDTVPPDEKAQPSVDKAPATRGTDSLPPSSRTMLATADASPPEKASAATATVRVHGRVLALPARTPIAGATVSAGTVRTTTDDHGAYELRLPKPCQAEVLAEADGFAIASSPVTLREAAPVTLDLLLSAFQRLTVRVVDRTSGAPIAGASVRMRWRGSRGARTDAFGLVEGEVVGEIGSFEVTASDYCPLRWTGSLPPGPRPTVDVSLLRVGIVEGTVRDVTGTPIVGAKVAESGAERMVSDIAGDVRSETPLRASTHTAADGTFELAVRPGLEPQRLSAHRQGYLRAESRPFVLAAAGQRQSVDFVLLPAGSVEGSVRCNGRPRGAFVRWRSDSEEGRERTDNGAFRLRDVPPGEIAVSLHDTLDGPAVQSRRITVVAGRVERCDFVWEEAMARIAGSVTTERGEAAARVHLVARSETASGALDHHARSDDHGRFEIEVAAGPTYRLQAGLGIASVEVHGVPCDANDVRIVLPALQDVRLLLRDGVTHEPFRGGGSNGFTIHWRRTDGDAFVPVPAEFDSHGVARLELPAGVADLRIVALYAGFVPRTITGLRLGGDAQAAPIPIDLQRGATVRLVLRGAEPWLAVGGGPRQVFVVDQVQRAGLRMPVSAAAYANPWGMRPDASAGDPAVLQQIPRFGADGAATIVGLAPGEYRLVTFPDDVVFEPATFVVGEGAAEVELRWRRR